MHKNASLLRTVEQALQNVTPESRQTAALIDRLEAQGQSLAAYFGEDR